MKHNPNFCCACGIHIKKEEWLYLFHETPHHPSEPQINYIDAEGKPKLMRLRICPNCKCVQGE